MEFNSGAEITHPPRALNADKEENGSSQSAPGVASTNIPEPELGVKLKPFICAECGKGFSHVSYYRCHLRIHGDAKYKCTVCDKACTTIQALKVHASSHGIGAGEFPCRICSKMFKFEHLRYAHERQRCEKRRVSSFCHDCVLEFKSVDTYKAHMAEHHDGEKPYKCDLCDESFVTVDHRRRHVRAQHTGLKKHPCSICGKLLSSVRVLRKHRAAVHKIKNKMFSTKDNVPPVIPSFTVSAKKKMGRPLKPKKDTESTKATSESTEATASTLSEQSTSAAATETESGTRSITYPHQVYEPISTTASPNPVLSAWPASQPINSNSYFSTGPDHHQPINSSTTSNHSYDSFSSILAYGLDVANTNHVNTVHYELPEPPRKSKNQSTEIRKRSKRNNGMYPCDICHKLYEAPKNVKRHKRDFHGIPFEKMVQPKVKKVKEKPQCDVCTIHYSSLRALRRHKRDIHRMEMDGTPITEPRTKKQYVTKSVQHERAILSSLLEFRAHIDTNEPSSSAQSGNSKPKLWHCAICLTDFAAERNLRRHQKKLHLVPNNIELVLPSASPSPEPEGMGGNEPAIEHIEDTPEQSEGDPVLTEKLQQLAQSITPWKEGQKNFKCQMCDRSFAYEYALDKHMEARHQPDSLPDWRSKKERREFMRAHRDEMSCDLCGLVVHGTFVLDTHRQMAHQKQCYECKEKFATVDDRKAHYLKEHAHLHCRFCDQKCADERAARDHERKQHRKQFFDNPLPRKKHEKRKKETQEKEKEESDPDDHPFIETRRRSERKKPEKKKEQKDMLAELMGEPSDSEDEAQSKDSDSD